MEIVQTRDFERNFKKLSSSIQRLYYLQKGRFTINFRDPRLHLKKLVGLDAAYSFRVTRSYRVLFYFQNTERAIFFDIDHRKDVYR